MLAEAWGWLSGPSGNTAGHARPFAFDSAGIIRPMVDRGLPIVDGAPACPFVAFEDDRDERATAPDHRHRCYAEPRPAPRALAHQDAYCLSANFPVCPTFQDWARREAAATRSASAARSEPTTDVELPPERHPLPPPDREARHAADTTMPPRRNPPRDWAAPPPWAGAAGAGGAAAAAGRAGEDGPPFLSHPRDATPPEARGLAGSAADRMAADAAGFDARGRSREPDAWALEDDDESPADDRRSGERRPFEPLREDAPVRPASEPPQTPPNRPARPDAEREIRWTERDTIGRRSSDAWSDPDADEDAAEPRRPARPPARGYVDRTRDRGGRIDPRRRDDVDRDDDARRAHEGPELFGPAWERPRRYEAYPTLRSRVSLPGVPGLSRVVVAVIALAVGVLLFFALPGLLGVGSENRPTQQPSATASPSPTIPPSPTPPPAPTPQTYVVASGDTLSRIAKRFGVTVDQLLEANTQIKDADQIAIGDRITIPLPTESDGGTETEPPPS